MALTDLQRGICQLLAAHRRSSGESDVAGGVALNELPRGARRSHDIDIFSDSEDAVQSSWDADRIVLLAHGYEVDVKRMLPAFVQATVGRDGRRVVLEWAQDSAFRYFPLVEHPVLGLALHPFDLATNKVLALVGRREVRDWIDTIRCHEALQPLGYLAWASAAKDPGFGPEAILVEAARTARYAQAELDVLDFEGEPPSAAALSRRWHPILQEAHEIIGALPPEHAGACVVDVDGELVRDDPSNLAGSLAASRVRFHRGSLRGAWPRLREPTA